MNHDRDDETLRNAFASEADWSLDSSSVQGRINAALDRRRRRKQAGAIVSAGLAISGLVFGVHALQPSGRAGDDRVATSPFTTTSAPPDPSAPAPSPSQPIPSKLSSPGPTIGGSYVDLPQRARDAYFAQTPEDCCSEAYRLAALWQVDVFDAKALAGQIVLDGGSLSDVASHDFADSTEAFFHRGYTAVDADHLAALWQEPTQTLSVKAVAGRMLLDGKTLQIRPGH